MSQKPSPLRPGDGFYLSVGSKKHVGRTSAASVKFAFGIHLGDCRRFGDGLADGCSDYLGLLLIFSPVVSGSFHRSVSEPQFCADQICSKGAVCTILSNAFCFGRRDDKHRAALRAKNADISQPQAEVDDLGLVLK